MKDSLLKISKWPLRSAWIASQMTIWSFILIGSFITSLVTYYSSSSISSTLPAITFGINGCGLILGGIVAGRITENRGWLQGGLQGVIYASLLIMISFLAFDSSMRLNPWLFLVFSSSISAIGGIIGFTTKRA